MRIYLSASSADMPAARKAMEFLRELGHEVPDWTLEAEREHDMSAEELRERALAAIGEVVDADALILIGPVSSGCLIEVGAALAALVPVRIVGGWTHFFTSHPCVRYAPGLASALRSLTERGEGVL